MNSFIRQSADEKRTYFEEAAAKLGLPAPAVEKDFWVCWTLNELFSLPGWGEHLTFKGGTSLSKVWKLINRFSEDIDLIIGRDYLGFAGDADPEKSETQSQEKKRIKRLKKACRKRVQEELLPSLIAIAAKAIPGYKADSLRFVDDDDNDTIEFHYPSVFPKGSLGSMLPYVKMEMGPRGDTWPAGTYNIHPYLEEALKERAPFKSNISVKVLEAERTFLEKAMLLHEESFRPQGRTRKARMARHYYDIYCMIRAGVAEKAINDPDLFDRVRTHRQFYFNVSWVDYDTMNPGKLKLVPSEDDLATWRSDYAAMSTVFFFGEEIPTFDTLMKAVLDFQTQLNKRGL